VGLKEEVARGMFYFGEEEPTTLCLRVLLVKRKDSLKNWHERLGHIHKQRVIQLSKGLAEGIGLGDEADFDCEVCKQTKMTVENHPKEKNRSPSHPGHIVSGDITGPFDVESFSMRYVSVLVDHYSGEVCVPSPGSPHGLLYVP
jgi:hypothetical protein